MPSIQEPASITRDKEHLLFGPIQEHALPTSNYPIARKNWREDLEK